MIVSMEQLSPGARYHLMTQSVIPRPIAWVLTRNEAGQDNLAPFSYFNVMSTEPPLVVFSVGHKASSEEKDTWLNIASTKQFIVHIAHVEQAAAVQQTAKELAHGASEIEASGLTTEVVHGWPLPRVIGCPIAMLCSLYEIKEIPPRPQAIIFGQVDEMFIEDRCLVEGPRLQIDPDAVKPLARLGAGVFSGITSAFSLPGK